MITKKKSRLPGKKSNCSTWSVWPRQILGSAWFRWIHSICNPRQIRIDILISGNRTFFFLSFIGSNLQFQLEKCIFWPGNRPPTATSQKPDNNSRPVAAQSARGKGRRWPSELSTLVLWLTVRNNISAQVRMGLSGKFWRLPVSMWFEGP
jgi:hypothetical protein